MRCASSGHSKQTWAIYFTRLRYLWLIHYYIAPSCLGSLKWCLHRRENIIRWRYHQQWRFEKMGEFLLKLHCSVKLLDPNCVCKQTFKWHLHRRWNITNCRYRQPWQFEKMGEFLLKSHLSLDPHCVCGWTFRRCDTKSIILWCVAKVSKTGIIVVKYRWDFHNKLRQCKWAFSLTEVPQGYGWHFAAKFCPVNTS